MIRLGREGVEPLNRPVTMTEEVVPELIFSHNTSVTPGLALLMIHWMMAVLFWSTDWVGGLTVTVAAFPVIVKVAESEPVPTILVAEHL